MTAKITIMIKHTIWDLQKHFAFTNITSTVTPYLLHHHLRTYTTHNLPNMLPWWPSAISRQGYFSIGARWCNI
jgi:hypothetical protein